MQITNQVIETESYYYDNVQLSLSTVDGETHVALCGDGYADINLTYDDIQAIGLAMRNFRSQHDAAVSRQNHQAASSVFPLELVRDVSVLDGAA